MNGTKTIERKKENFWSRSAEQKTAYSALKSNTSVIRDFSVNRIIKEDKLNKTHMMWAVKSTNMAFFLSSEVITLFHSTGKGPLRHIRGSKRNKPNTRL